MDAKACGKGQIKYKKRCHKVYFPRLTKTRPSLAVLPGEIEDWKQGKVRVLRTDRGKIISSVKL